MRITYFYMQLVDLESRYMYDRLTQIVWVLMLLVLV